MERKYEREREGISEKEERKRGRQRIKWGFHIKIVPSTDAHAGGSFLFF